MTGISVYCSSPGLMNLSANSFGVADKSEYLLENTGFRRTTLPNEYVMKTLSEKFFYVKTLPKLPVTVGSIVPSYFRKVESPVP